MCVCSVLMEEYLCVLCMCVNRSVYLYVREYFVHCMCVNMFLCLVCVCTLYIVHVQVCALLCA